MDEHDIWREKLRRLVEGLGRGGRSIVANALNKDPSYVSRMMSDPTTEQHRKVTHETYFLLSKAFPNWLDDAPPSEGNSTHNENKLHSQAVIYEVQPKSKRDRSIDTLLQVAARINDDGIERLIGMAEVLSQSHPVSAKQTRK